MAHESAPPPRTCSPSSNPAPADLARQPVFREIVATIVDSSNRPITGLNPGDIQLYENSQRRPLEFLEERQHLHVSVILLAETSMSMRTKLSEEGAGIRDLARKLPEQDDVSLYGFDERVFPIEPWTTDRRLVEARLDATRSSAQGATLFDALAAGVNIAKGGCYPDRVLIVVTSGSSVPGNIDRERTEQLIKASGVLVFLVGVGNQQMTQTVVLSTPPRGPVGGGGVNIELLSGMARDVGGQFFQVHQTEDGSEGDFPSTVDAIVARLSSGYIIGYKSTAGSDQDAAEVRVSVPAHPNARISIMGLPQPAPNPF